MQAHSVGVIFCPVFVRPLPATALCEWENVRGRDVRMFANMCYLLVLAIHAIRRQHSTHSHHFTCVCSTFEHTRNCEIVQLSVQRAIIYNVSRVGASHIQNCNDKIQHLALRIAGEPNGSFAEWFICLD